MQGIASSLTGPPVPDVPSEQYLTGRRRASQIDTHHPG